MNSNEKRWIILLIAVVIIAIVLIVVLAGNKGKKGQIDQGTIQGQEVEEETTEQYTEELIDGTKINTSEEFNSTKKYENIEISNIQFVEKEGISTLLADLRNTGSTKHEEEIVKITILGEQGKEITELKAVIGEIEAGSTKRLNASITADVTNAKDFKIEPVR